MLVTTTEMFRQAEAGGYAVPSANFLDHRMASAFVTKAESLRMPLILSFAQVHIPVLPLEQAAAIGLHLAKNSTVPVALHLDHGQDEETIKRAIALGFTSVMIDASTLEFTENIAITKRVVDYAHARNVVVEAELGHVGSGISLEAQQSDSIYTDPKQASLFCKTTGIDSLAISIGTAHGHYKGVPKINYECLKAVRKATDIPLVLHGGSSSGDENLHQCAKRGIHKINIFTDFITAAHQTIYADKHKDMLTLNRVVSEAYQDTLGHCFEVFATQKWRATNETTI